jgi:Rrf2 family protein
MVESKRGVHGGYTLAQAPSELSVGETIRLVDGSFDPVSCGPVGGRPACALADNCAFANLWSRARKAVEEVYDKTTFQDLLDEYGEPGEGDPPMYAI